MIDIITPFKVGDVTQLKSGGPYMTVSEVFETGEIRTTWFDIKGHPVDGYYNVATLIHSPVTRFVQSPPFKDMLRAEVK